MSKYPTITVIIPVRNESTHMRACISSILEQDYPSDKMKVIFIDGASEDETRSIIKEYVDLYPELFELHNNPKKIVPVAMNIGIGKAKSDYIIRLDAHSEYSSDYIRLCIETIMEVDADNVGGLALSKARGRLGEAFAQVLSSKFGVGNSSFRTNCQSGFVDTVPFGTYRRAKLIEIGKYDERLVRNQDYELNYRIRKHGGKIYLNSSIKLFYNCKNTWSGIVRQSYDNGKWNVITMKLCPGSMGLRHFIPLVFVMSILLLSGTAMFFPILGLALCLEIGLYGILNIYYSSKNAERRYRNHVFIKMLLFPVFHISYGIGSLVGLMFNQKPHTS